MYGKIFSSMYEGSMIGAGATVFAVMGYAISRQQPPDFNVELNAKLLSAILGEPEESVIKAIEYLCAPDPGSRTETEDGRRLIKVGAFTYHMVNGEAYHAIRNSEERRAYNREAQAKYREKKKAQGVSVPPPREPEKSSPRFQKPTVQQLRDYAAEIQFHGFDAQKFFDHYEANGWKRNKTPIKDWQACVRTWRSNQSQYSGSGGGSGTSNSSTRNGVTPKAPTGSKFYSEMTPEERAYLDESMS